MLLVSMAYSLVAGIVAGSCIWSDVISSSGSLAIFSTVAPCGDGSSVEADLGSPSLVGSGIGSTQRSDGGLGSGPVVELVRSSSGTTVNRDSFFVSIHSTKEAKSTRGPYLDEGALHARFRLAS